MIPSIIAGAKRWCVPNSSLLLQRVFQEAAWQSNILGGSLTLLRHQSKTYFSVFGQQEELESCCVQKTIGWLGCAIRSYSGVETDTKSRNEHQEPSIARYLPHIEGNKTGSQLTRHIDMLSLNSSNVGAGCAGVQFLMALHPGQCSTHRVISGRPGIFGMNTVSGIRPHPIINRTTRDVHMLSSGSGDGGQGGGNNDDNSLPGNGGGDDDDDEFLNLQQAEEMAAAKGIELPQDYAHTAANGGIRASVLAQYCVIASGGYFTSLFARMIPAFRDRLIADRLYFYKLLVEVVIDSGCATVAEVRKRGEEFWDEFEFYLSDMLVGLVMDVVLVSLLAPVAVAGRQRKVPQNALRRWSSQLPSAVFEKSTDKKYTISDRFGCFIARGLEYSLAGIVCGFVGQGIASGLMVAKRNYVGSKEGEVEVPPVFESALVWGAFMGLSANTRYQIVFGLERIVDETIARRIPQVAYFTTMAIRFVNNIIGGEQFIDMARWAGVQ